MKIATSNPDSPWRNIDRQPSMGAQAGLIFGMVGGAVAAVAFSVITWGFGIPMAVAYFMFGWFFGGVLGSAIGGFLGFILGALRWERAAPAVVALVCVVVPIRTWLMSHPESALLAFKYAAEVMLLTAAIFGLIGYLAGMGIRWAIVREDYL